MENLLFPTGTKIKLESLFYIDLNGELVERLYVVCYTKHFNEMLVEVPLNPTQQQFETALLHCLNWLKKRSRPESMTELISANLADYQKAD